MTSDHRIDALATDLRSTQMTLASLGLLTDLLARSLNQAAPEIMANALGILRLSLQEAATDLPEQNREVVAYAIHHLEMAMGRDQATAGRDPQ